MILQPPPSMADIIELAIREDIFDGDHTTLSTIPETATGSALLVSKDNGILAGVEIAHHILKKIDRLAKINTLIKDGQTIKRGDKILTINAKVRSILQAERIVLNFMQRMSGIATETAKYAKTIADLPTKILDTRKTTPNMRIFEKMAVKIGGGTNHRFGLYDMIMIKDNHIDFAGSIEKAINNVHKYLKQKNKNLKIEIEVRNFNELEQVLKTGKIHRIMLDNFSVKNTKEAVKIINKRYETESSGGITLETLRNYAECGVDYISVGALTHQIKSLDLSLIANF